MQRENFDILTNAEVDKTIFDSSRDSLEAVGIQDSQDQQSDVYLPVRPIWEQFWQVYITVCTSKGEYY